LNQPKVTSSWHPKSSIEFETQKTHTGLNILSIESSIVFNIAVATIIIGVYISLLSFYITHSILWIVLSYMCSGVVFIILGQNFTGFIIITIYGGALSILMVISCSLVGSSLENYYSKEITPNRSILILILLFMLLYNYAYKLSNLPQIGNREVESLLEINIIGGGYIHPVESLTETC
jgi:NADH:ubiquinone oxidoreductase subunit 6 (subunit J)